MVGMLLQGQMCIYFQNTLYYELPYFVYVELVYSLYMTLIKRLNRIQKKIRIGNTDENLKLKL